MKIKSRNIILLLAAIFATISCGDDFLTQEPQGSLNVETLATEKGANALLTASYSLLDGHLDIPEDGSGGGRGSASPSNWIWGEVCSDNAYKGDNTNFWTNIIELETFNIEPTNQQLLWAWEIYYEAISRANSALTVINKLKSDLPADDPKLNTYKQLEAEAKFLRAWYHFELRTKFQKIPYITEDIVDPTTVANDVEVWDLIEADVKWGIDNEMAEMPTEVGRVSRWAAKAFLGRVHLFQEEYTEAAALFDQVIEGPFRLADHFYDNFDDEKQNFENNPESIFEIQYSVGDGADEKNGRSDMLTVMPNMGDAIGYDYFRPSYDLFNAYKVDADGLPMFDTYADDMITDADDKESDEEYYPTDHQLDPRVDWTIGRRGIPYLDWGVHIGADFFSQGLNGGITVYGPFHQKKHAYYKRNRDQIAFPISWVKGNHANNFRAIRLGHVLLWRAECAAETNDLGTALALVNQIRERAQDDLVMGYVSDSAFTQGALDSDTKYAMDSTQPAANYSLGLYPSFPDQEYAINAVRWETRLETALEGFRFFDLARWGIDAEVMQAWITQENALIQDGHRADAPPFGTYVSGKHNHWPLPQTQLDLQTGVLQQSDNY